MLQNNVGEALAEVKGPKAAKKKTVEGRREWNAAEQCRRGSCRIKGPKAAKEQ